MCKKLIQIIALLCLAVSPLVLISAQAPRWVQQQNLGQFASYAPQTRQAINLLQQLPEFRELLIKVQNEGPVHVKVEAHPSFEGLWDGNSRSIVINSRLNRTLGQMICTILFELHNAATARYYDDLIVQAENGRLTKDQYVEKVELAEFKNAKNTHDLLEKGIKMGLFPESAHWPVPLNFDEHYKVQQVSGHSQFIANSYDQINPRARGSMFRGTIQRPAWLGEQDKDELCRYIMMRAGLDSEDEGRADRFREDLHKEITRLENSHHKRAPRQDIERLQRRVELIKIAMKGNPDFIAATENLDFIS